MQLSQDAALSAVAQQLREIGYTGGLLQQNYRFANILGTGDAVLNIPLATFAQQPPSYRNACFGVVIGVEDRALPQYRSLGAPQLLQIHDGDVRRWKMTATGAPQLLRVMRPHELEKEFQAHREAWSPDAMLRGRSVAADIPSRQLDLFDTGLLPMIEEVVHRRLDDLLQDAITASKAAYVRTHKADPDFHALCRLVFRLLAAKMFADRMDTVIWQSPDPDIVLSEIEQYYFRGTEAEPALHDPQARRVAWDQIRSSFHLQNISVEALAYVYEHTLVTQETRRRYGTHSTPPAIADYLVQHLPLEDLPEEQRTVFEPFAGCASLLIAALGRLRGLLPSHADLGGRHEYFRRMLGGIELDAFAHEVAWFSLVQADFPNRNGWNLLHGDAFTDERGDRALAAAQVVLCNPPFQDFTPEEVARYPSLRSTNKAADALLRVLERPPSLLGFILPRVFIDGQRYREARRHLASTYDNISLLALPDIAFGQSDAETVLLTAHGKQQRHLTLRTGSVSKPDYEVFLRSARPTTEDEETFDRPTALTMPALWLYPLRKVWAALDGLRMLGDIADVHRGIEYNISLIDHRAELISPNPRPGFLPGLDKVTSQFEPFVSEAHVHLNMDRKLMRREADKLPWDQPKVLVNAARRGRGPWALTAVPDRSRLVAYQRFLGIWPNADALISSEVIAAILNGPVANAFVSVNQTSRDNRIKTIERIPIPRLTPEEVGAITTLVAQYQALRRDWLNQMWRTEDLAARCRETLLQIDAEVLTAYDLPPRLERDLLDYFSGYQRPGPVAFTEYYPRDFVPALPWRMYVSGAVGRATVAHMLERLPPRDDPELAALVADLRASED